MTRFLHITDLHLRAAEVASGRRKDNTAKLQRLIEKANGLSRRPAFIVASGDLTDAGDRESYALLRDMAEGFEAPVVWALGNHDKREGFHAVFPGYPGGPSGPLDHDETHAGVHVIVADTSVPGQVSGALDEAQLARLERALEREADLPKLLVLHHPPKITGARNRWAHLDGEATARLAELIAGRNILAILSGHIHMNRVTIWRGAPLVITTGHDSAIDLTWSEGLRLYEDPSFAICDLTPDGLSVGYATLEDRPAIREIPAERLEKFR